MLFEMPPPKKMNHPPFFNTLTAILKCLHKKYTVPLHILLLQNLDMHPFLPQMRDFF